MLSVNETKIKAVCAIYLHRRKIIYSLHLKENRSGCSMVFRMKVPK